MKVCNDVFAKLSALDYQIRESIMRQSNEHHVVGEN